MSACFRDMNGDAETWPASTNTGLSRPTGWRAAAAAAEQAAPHDVWRVVYRGTGLVRHTSHGSPPPLLEAARLVHDIPQRLALHRQPHVVHRHLDVPRRCLGRVALDRHVRRHDKVRSILCTPQHRRRARVSRCLSLFGNMQHPMQPSTDTSWPAGSAPRAGGQRAAARGPPSPATCTGSRSQRRPAQRRRSCRPSEPPPGRRGRP